MINSVTWSSLRSLVQQNKLALIDTRSAAEYAQGHCPGAVNIPLLDDAERHEVGLCYKTDGRLPAVQMGLAIFSAKVDVFIDQVSKASIVTTPAPHNFANSFDPKKNRPKVAVYCWRGGMRSQAVARLLDTLGFDVLIIKGGYKAFRKEVLQALDLLAVQPLVVLNGLTGVGKTVLLKTLGKTQPTIDFEALACHRGSAFGHFAQPEPSPTQQQFENLIANAYLAVCHHKRIIVEIEGAIGPVTVPAKIRRHILQSPMIFLDRDIAKAE